jgi:hypothetical protein
MGREIESRQGIGWYRCRTDILVSQKKFRTRVGRFIPVKPVHKMYVNKTVSYPGTKLNTRVQNFTQTNGHFFSLRELGEGGNWVRFS